MSEHRAARGATMKGLLGRLGLGLSLGLIAAGACAWMSRPGPWERWRFARDGYNEPPALLDRNSLLLTRADELVCLDAANGGTAESSDPHTKSCWRKSALLTGCLS